MASQEELHVAGLELLLAAIHADDPKREILVRVGDAIREAKAIAERGGVVEECAALLDRWAKNATKRSRP